MVILHLNDQPPLIKSIFAGEADEVRTLLQSHEHDVNYLDVAKRTPLHAAAFKGDCAIAALLLTHGARVNAKDSKWYTPLHRACYIGAEDTVALLLRHQADCCARDRLWQTPLHVAAANDTYGCVAALLSHVPNPNISDRSGHTALHHAAFNGHTQVAELLIAKGAIVNACDKKDCRPLHCATYMGHIDTIELLLRHGADINAADRNQYTPLHVAAASGMELACRPLLYAGAKPDLKNSYGNTPLHIACLNGHLPICQMLVGHDADIEAVNYRGQTPLHIAAASTHGVECMLFLLEHGANINRRSADGRTPLHMTAIHGRFTRSKTLLDRGAVVDYADENGCTPLHIAAQCGHELLANTLLAFGADPSQKGYEGRTPLHMCCLSGYVECCRKFLQAGVDLNIKDNSGKTATHCAAVKGSVECLDLLVSSGANFQLADDLGRIPLHYAAVHGHYQCVFTLVSIGSRVNLADADGCSPLHLAAGYNLEGKCVDYLLQHKADPTLKNNKGFTPIHYAVAGGNFVGLEYILTVVGKQFLMYGPHMPLTTPLHLAARHGNAEVLRLLLQYFPDTNIRTQRGSSPLLLAAREGHTHCVQMLLRYGAKVAITENVMHMGPIHMSAKNGHMHCLALLLDNTEDKAVGDGQDRLHRTPLMLAVSGNHGDCVLTLLKAGANPNIADADNHTPLFRAVVAGQSRIVQLLISEGARANLIDVHGKSVFHVAAACGHAGCLQSVHDFLAEDEAQAFDKQQLTALHWACYAGSAACVEFLLEKDIFKGLSGNAYSAMHCACFSGSERCVELLCKRYGSQIVHLEDTRRRRPLHVAALMGHIECAKLLLEEGAQTEALDIEGRTPIVLAAQFGQSGIADLLLSYRANLTSHDKNGNNALHWACLKNHSHTALLLLDYVSNNLIVNLANAEGRTPLHIAARNGLVEVTHKLLETGASTVAVDCEGMTPEMGCIQNSKVAQCLSLLLKKCPESTTASGDSSKSSLSMPAVKRKIRMRTFKNAKSQTDLSLLRTAELLECDYLFEWKPAQHPHHSVGVIDGSESEVSVLFPKVKFPHDEASAVGKSSSVFIVENYGECGVSEGDEEFQVALQRKKSDMFIARAYGTELNVMEVGTEVSQTTLDSVSCMTVNKFCKECLHLRKKCASCLLKRLMKQHVTGKLKITELRSVLKEICMTADPEYKRSLIRSLENFKNCLQEKKLTSSQESFEEVAKNLSLKDTHLNERTAIAGNFAGSSVTSSCLSLTRDRAMPSDRSKKSSGGPSLELKMQQRKVAHTTRIKMVASESAASGGKTEKTLENMSSPDILKEGGGKKSRPSMLPRHTKNAELRKSKKSKEQTGKFEEAGGAGGIQQPYALRSLHIGNIQKKIDEEVAEIVHEIYVKELKKPPPSEPKRKDECSLRILDTTNDDRIVNFNEFVEQERLENEKVEQLAIENLKTLNRSPYSDPMRQLEIIQMGLEELKDTEYLGKIAEFVQYLKTNKSPNEGAGEGKSEEPNDDDDGDSSVPVKLEEDDEEEEEQDDEALVERSEEEDEVFEVAETTTDERDSPKLPPVKTTEKIEPQPTEEPSDIYETPELQEDDDDSNDKRLTVVDEEETSEEVLRVTVMENEAKFFDRMSSNEDSETPGEEDEELSHKPPQLLQQQLKQQKQQQLQQKQQLQQQVEGVEEEKTEEVQTVVVNEQTPEKSSSLPSHDDEYAVKVQLSDENAAVERTLNVEIFSENFVADFSEDGGDHGEKAIVNGNISLVPYAQVKEDTLWENIEKSSESLMLQKCHETKSETGDTGTEDGRN